MTPSPRTLLALSLLLGACKKDEAAAMDTASTSSGTIDGIYMVEVPIESNDNCTDTIEHNFADAYLPDDNEEWTNDTSSAQSSSLTFIQIIQIDEENAILIWENDAFPGTGEDEDWTFLWSGEESNSTSESHESGYEFSTSTSATSSVVFAAEFDEGELSGTWESVSRTNTQWTESDTWSKTLLASPQLGETGQIPSALYLVVDMEQLNPKTGQTMIIEGAAQTNEWDSFDCTAEPCSLKVVAACEGSYEITGVWTGYTEDDAKAYEGVGGVGQPPGS